MNGWMSVDPPKHHRLLLRLEGGKPKHNRESQVQIPRLKRAQNKDETNIRQSPIYCEKTKKSLQNIVLIACVWPGTGPRIGRKLPLTH